MMRWLTALVFILLTLNARAGDTPLILRDVYTTGGANHLVIESATDLPVALDDFTLTRVADGFSPPLWWVHAEPAILLPGMRGRVSFAARRPAQLEGAFDVTVGAASLRASLVPASEPDPLVVTHVLESGGALTVFVQNKAAAPLVIQSVALQGESLSIDAGRSSSTIAPGETGVLTVMRAPGATPYAPDAAVLLEIGTASSLRYRHAYVFRPPLFRVREGEVADAFICPAHRHGPFDRAAQKIFGLVRNPQGLLPEVHFCRNRLTEALLALGQSTPRAIINAQGSNPKRGTDAAWQGLDAVLSLARTNVQPGIVAALIEPGSNFDGAPGLMTHDPVDPISALDLQQTAYRALAQGAKGLVFRLGLAPDPTYVAMVNTLMHQFEAIAPWVETLEPVSLGSQCAVPGVSVATLYAGRGSLLLVVTTSAQPATETSGPITLRRPPWFTPDTLVEVGGAWRESPVQPDGDSLILDGTTGAPVALYLLRGK